MTLEGQDRSRWNRDEITEELALLDAALRRREPALTGGDAASVPIRLPARGTPVVPRLHDQRIADEPALA